MKIGIATCWNTPDNYGTMLQVYAVQTYLRSLGHEPFLIRNDFKNQNEALLKKIVRVYKNGGIGALIFQGFRSCFFRFLNPYANHLRRKNSLRDFDGFRNRYYVMSRIYRSYQEVAEDPPEADLYIAGSDQPWNFLNLDLYDFSRDLMRFYFLDFGVPETKRAAFSVSFGPPEINLAHKELMTKLLINFDFLSIRENAGVKLCHLLGRRDAVLQRDPTLLLDADEYRQLFINDDSAERIQSEKFVLLYLLNNQVNFSIGRLKRWAKKKGMKLVYITGNTHYFKFNLHKKNYATVPQFLSLMDKASYVFTNSFHGCMFSVIFHKPFLYMNQTGGLSAQNPRLYETLAWLGLEKRIFSENFESIGNPINWDSVQAILNENKKNLPFAKWLMNNFPQNVIKDKVFERGRGGVKRWYEISPTCCNIKSYALYHSPAIRHVLAGRCIRACA